MDDPNKLHHIFDNPDHNLAALVQAVYRVHRSGDLVLDVMGLYRQAFDVGGYRVMVRGRIVDGMLRVGSAWIPSEDNDAQA